MTYTNTSAQHKVPLGHDIIVVGASAGGVEALAELVQRLPDDLQASVFIVLHVPAYSSSVLPSILSRRGALPARHPIEGEAIRPGHIYVASPDYHMILREGHVHLTRGPSENGHRPAIDTLFRSAARSYGPRVLGVILTGTLDDGTAGLQAIKMRGGLALVQDPEEAMFASMPHNAIENVAVDFVQPLASLAETLTRLTREPGITTADALLLEEAPPGQSEIEIEAEITQMEIETEIAELDKEAIETPRDGHPSPFSCPDCHGVLWETQEGGMLRFRCRVGHAYSAESLLACQSENLEEALWIALRALEESAAMAERLQGRAAERGHMLAARRFEDQAGHTRGRAEVIRQALADGQPIANPGPPLSEVNKRSAPFAGAFREGEILL